MITRNGTVAAVSEQNGALTVKSVIASYIAHARRTLSERTLQEVERVVLLFARDFGSHHITALRPIDLQQWLESHPTWTSDWTVKRILGSVKACFSWAAKTWLIERNPFAGMTWRCGESGQPMNELHWQALLRSSAPEFRRYLTFLRFTGCRPGEAAALHWPNIDLVRGVAMLHKHKTVRTQRTPRPRLIVLHPVAIALLKWVKRRSNGTPHVFGGKYGQQWTRNALTLRLRRLREKLGIPKDCKLQSVRHAFATRAVRSGVDIKTLSELLGHTTTKMSERYVHIAGNVNHLRQALLKFDWNTD